jgi:hypothetical protein
MEHITKTFKALTLLYQRKPGDHAEERLLLGMWMSTLSDLTPAELADATREYCKRGKFFPRPADILEVAERLRLHEPPSRQDALPQYTTADLADNEARAKANLRRIKELLRDTCR